MKESSFHLSLGLYTRPGDAKGRGVDVEDWNVLQRLYRLFERNTIK